MAGSSEDHYQKRHSDVDDDELEEGEFVPGPGCHSESDTEEYYNHYSSESEDEATSNAWSHSVPTNNNGGDVGRSSSVAANGNGYASSSSVSVAAAPALACRVCGKEFTSTKAVCGHMKVHALEAQWRQEQGNGKKEEEVKRTAPVEKGWGFTGKRGFPGSRCRSVSPPNAEPERFTTAIVAAEPKLILEPTPLAYAAPNLSSVRAAPAKIDISGEGSGAQSIHKDAMAIVVAPGADPPTEAAVHQQAAPLPAAAGAEAAPVVHQQRAAPPAAGAQSPDGHTCGECGKWFRTHQALGGHVAGHKSRRLAAAGVVDQHDGAVPCRRGSKPKKRHVCRVCSVEFPKGVQLGGHMRKHYTGEAIVPSKKQRVHEPVPSAADVVVTQLDPADLNMAEHSLALPVEADDVKSPAPTVEAAQPAPSPAVEGTPKPTLAPRVTGRVILFGIDIGLGVQKLTVQEDSPATNEDSLA